MVAITMPDPRKPFSFGPQPGEAQMRDERTARAELGDFPQWDMVENRFVELSEEEVAARLRAVRGGLPDAVDMGAPTEIPATFSKG